MILWLEILILFYICSESDSELPVEKVTSSCRICSFAKSDSYADGDTDMQNNNAINKAGIIPEMQQYGADHAKPRPLNSRHRSKQSKHILPQDRKSLKIRRKTSILQLHRNSQNIESWFSQERWKHCSKCGLHRQAIMILIDKRTKVDKETHEWHEKKSHQQCAYGHQSARQIDLDLSAHLCD